MSHQSEPAAHHPRFKIKIDREQYEVDQEHMTGAELRQVPPTPILADRDLYEVHPGQDDELITDEKVVTIRNGSCHLTFGGITGFDAHRRNGQCVMPKGYVQVKGVWRQPGPDRPFWGAREVGA